MFVWSKFSSQKLCKMFNFIIQYLYSSILLCPAVISVLWVKIYDKSYLTIEKFTFWLKTQSSWVFQCDFCSSNK